MDRNEALASLDAVSQTDRKMAQKMHWPFWRHALFGIAEGLLVIGLGANGAIGATAMGGGVACLLLLMYGDRQRDGMFVSGFKGKRTRPLMWAIMVLVIGSLALSMFVLKWEEGTNPQVVALGIGLAVILTGASILWQRLYRAELRVGASQ